MSETPLFFPGSAQPLFGVFHAPSQPSGTTFVFCHAFAEEKLWAHRVFVAFARRLCAGGHPVLRFDFAGNGDSAGEFAEASLAGAVADVAAAMAKARQLSGSDPISLLGLRLGATIASLAADQLPGEVQDLVLWAPIVDGGRYMQDLLRVNLTTQMAVHKEVRMDRAQLVAEMQEGRSVNVDGYELAYPLFSEISAVSLGARPARHPGRCLIAQVGKAAARILPETQTLADAYARPTIMTVVEEPFWKEIPQFYQDASQLAGATLDWLRTA